VTRALCMIGPSARPVNRRNTHATAEIGGQTGGAERLF
jgi:hypothetical protein